MVTVIRLSLAWVQLMLHKNSEGEKINQQHKRHLGVQWFSFFPRQWITAKWKRHQSLRYQRSRHVCKQSWSPHIVLMIFAKPCSFVYCLPTQLKKWNCTVPLNRNARVPACEFVENTAAELHYFWKDSVDAQRRLFWMVLNEWKSKLFSAVVVRRSTKWSLKKKIHLAKKQTKQNS